MSGGDFLGDALEARQCVLQLATRPPVKVTEPRHIWAICIDLKKEMMAGEDEGHKGNGGRTLNREAVKKN